MCMGNTPRSGPGRTSSWVHPHVYGEYFIRSCFYPRYLGPSPCVWGIRRGVAVEATESGSIPMCMGNTGFARTRHGRNWVHPHVYGEYLIFPEPLLAVQRSIPMCMGNTATTTSCIANARVHPHVYGEY